MKALPLAYTAFAILTGIVMCRFTYDQNVQQLWDLHHERLDWDTEAPLLVQVQRSWTDTELVETNVISTIAQAKARKRKTTDDDFYWLPKRFSTNTEPFRTDELAPYFVRPAVECGFNLIMKGYEDIKVKAGSPQEGGVVKFMCNRGRKHKDKTPKDTEKAPNHTP
jgi:hypothetical protein